MLVTNVTTKPHSREILELMFSLNMINLYIIIMIVISVNKNSQERDL